jgi:hypothetical protein
MNWERDKAEEFLSLTGNQAFRSRSIRIGFSDPVNFRIAPLEIPSISHLPIRFLEYPVILFPVRFPERLSRTRPIHSGSQQVMLIQLPLKHPTAFRFLLNSQLVYPYLYPIRPGRLYLADHYRNLPGKKLRSGNCRQEMPGMK